MNAKCTLMAVAVIAAVSSLAYAGDDLFVAKHVGYDSHQDIWFLNDKYVTHESECGQYNELRIDTFSKKEYPELVNNVAIAEQCSKASFQTFDNRIDIKDWKDYQFVGLYDGINNPSVVNKVRAFLLRNLANNLGEQLDELSVAFSNAKLGGDQTLLDTYMQVKTKVFNTISETLEDLEQNAASVVTKDAATLAVAIIAPEFVIVVQVGNVHIIGYSDTNAVELTMQQSRQNLDEVRALTLDECKDILQIELCATTRIVGNTSPKGGKTHSSLPFVKLYKRVYAPALNNNDLVLNDTGRKAESLSDEQVPDGTELDTAGMRVERSAELEAALASGDDEAANVAEQQLNEEAAIQFLLFETEPIAQKLTPDDSVRAVLREFTEHKELQVGSIKSIAKSALKNIFDIYSSKRGGVDQFVSSFYSDFSLIIVPLETDSTKYHY